MSEIAVQVDHVWKRFHRGEFHDSLRDAIPAFFQSLVGKTDRQELGKGDFWALKDVSFEVKKGESFGIIGHNGAGKSTMLKILSRIIKPNRGNVRMEGRLGTLIEIGAGFHGDLTGRENIYLNGTILGMKKAEIDRKFDEIVDFSGIEEFLDTPVKRYSSGMHARLGFAVAAHLEPEILIVDEVLSVGDTAFQKKCLGKMNDVVSQGRTVLFVSHNMAAVKNLCNRAILLQKGEIVAEGFLQDVISCYIRDWNENEFSNLRDNYSLRAGDGRARIQKISMGNDLDHLSVHHISNIGEELWVQVEYESFAPIKEPVVQVVFGNVEDYVFEVNTFATPQKLEHLNQTGKIIFQIPNFPLAAGEYPLYASIKDASNHNIILVDEWPQAGLLKLSKDNSLGYDFSIGFCGRTFAPHQWQSE